MTSSIFVNAVIIGGGPAGLAPLVWAARQGTLPSLSAGGLIVIERGSSVGAGSLGQHAIGSDTLADTFLECLEDSAEPRLTALRDHPAALALATYRGGSAPLPAAAAFLSALGAVLSDAIRSAGGQVLTGCEALWSRRRSDGAWQTRWRSMSGEHEITSRYLVLAAGARECQAALYTRTVAGHTLLPRLAGKLMLSGAVLAAGGADEVARRLDGIVAPKVVIVGGSHSALATANLLLDHSLGTHLEAGAITLMHRRPLRVFYPSAAAAEADGYTDFDDDDICPVSKRLFRLAGFRLEARRLVMRALGIGGQAPEPRLRLHRLQDPGMGARDTYTSNAEAEARRLLDEADLVVAALGYRPSAPPVFDSNGDRLVLAEDETGPAPLVDRQCRVLDRHRLPIPGLLGIGLAAGFIPGGALGGEPSFRGQTNGIWLWQNGVGAMIVDVLLGPAQLGPAQPNPAQPGPAQLDRRTDDVAA